MQVQPYVVLSFCSAIFFIGFAGLLIRRNILVIMMSIELMLNAVNLTFVTFSKQLHDISAARWTCFLHHHRGGGGVSRGPGAGDRAFPHPAYRGYR